MIRVGSIVRDLKSEMPAPWMLRCANQPVTLQWFL
jgi:hypothetical protein